MQKLVTRTSNKKKSTVSQPNLAARENASYAATDILLKNLTTFFIESCKQRIMLQYTGIASVARQIVYGK